jgi:hypothetical protein
VQNRHRVHRESTRNDPNGGKRAILVIGTWVFSPIIAILLFLVCCTPYEWFGGHSPIEDEFADFWNTLMGRF